MTTKIFRALATNVVALMLMTTVCGCLAGTANPARTAEGAAGRAGSAPAAPTDARAKKVDGLSVLLTALSSPGIFTEVETTVNAKLSEFCRLSGSNAVDDEFSSRSYICSGGGLKAASLLYSRKSTHLYELLVEFDSDRYKVAAKVVAEKLGSPTESTDEALLWSRFKGSIPKGAGKPVITLVRPLQEQGDAVFSVSFETPEP